MKKMFKALVMMACALSLGLATACSDDDDEDLLIGTWQLVSEVYDNGTVVDSSSEDFTLSNWTFAKDGKLTMVMPTYGNYTLTATYTRKGNTLTVTSQGESDNATIKTLTKTELSIYIIDEDENDDEDLETTGNFTANFKRI